MRFLDGWNRRGRSLLAGALVACAGGRGALCMGEEVQERTGGEEFVEPVLIEETLPNAPGELSVRLTTDYRRGDGDAVGTLPNLQLFYGLCERVGASLAVPAAYVSSVDGVHYGLGDLSTDLKCLLLKPAPTLPAVVAGVEATFPTGSRTRSLGEGVYELTPNVALLKDFGSFCLQGGFGWAKQVGSRHRDAWTYGWAASAPLVKQKLNLLLEAQGDWAGTSHATLAPGVKYSLTQTFAFGLASPLGLNRNTDKWGVITQAQIDF